MSTAVSSSTSSSAAQQAASIAASASVISSQGIGSGLDIPTIVSELTTAEAGPETDAINRSNTALNAQVSAFGAFQSAVSTFQATLSALTDPAQLVGRTATLGDTTIASATATSSAIPGQYSIAVQNLASAASLSSQPIASDTTAVGTGNLTLSVNGVSGTLTIDSSDNTLQGIAAAINSGTGNPGVSASILTTSEGSRLVLTGTNTGAKNGITVTESGGDGGLASLVYDPADTTVTSTLTQTQAAQDAAFTVNGYGATSASNSVSSVITGVTLNLTKASAATTTTSTAVPPVTTTTYTPTTLSIGNDTSGTSTSVGTFVTALNGVISTIASLTSYDPTTQEAGPLLGNSVVQAFQSQLSKILGTVNGSITSGPNSLAALGITANSDGSYSANTTTISNALSGSLASVSSLLSGTNGIATQLNTLITNYTQSGGLLDTISSSLKASLTANTTQMTALTARMAVYSASLTTEYNAMDNSVALLKQTQTYLTAEFNSGSTSSSSSSSLSSGTVST